MREQNSANYGDHLNPQHYEFNSDDEIDLRELFGVLWAEKKVIIGITMVAAVISVVISLLMTEIYRAEVTLAPAETEQGAAGLMGQLGGAAALLGVSVGGNSGNIVSTALAVLQSRQFIIKFINDNKLLVPLFASRWNKGEQSSVIDTNIYNPTSGSWLMEGGEPTEQAAYRAFREIFTVTGPDRNTGIIIAAINWHNPVEAAQWVNKLIVALNQEVRARDINEAMNAITYLRQQLETTQLVDMQRVFYQLIESQTRITMLADVRDEYVFRLIDPAVVPDRKVAPRRAVISIVGTLAGAMLSLIFIFLRKAYKGK